VPPKRLLALLLLAALAASPGPAAAASPPPEGDRPPAAPSEKPAPPPKAADGSDGEEDDDHDTWLDVSHAFLERRIFSPVFRFDRFFSDERELEEERERSFLRWRSEVRFTGESSQPSFTTGVRATLRLPGLNKRLRRLRVVLAGETRDAVSTLFPRGGGEEGPAAEPTTGDEDLSRGDAGLRFYLWDSLVSHADLGGGVLVRLPPGVYGRLRLRWAVPVAHLFLARSAVTGFWRSDVRFGTSAAAEIERPLARRAALRLGGTATLSEESAGVEWGAELALLAAFGQRVGGQFGAAVNGRSRPLPLETTAVVPPDVDRYRLYARLRRDVYRRWLFVELEPEVAWPWDDLIARQLALGPATSGLGGIATLVDGARGRHPVWGIALRVEVQFHGNEAPPPEPPPPAPEPRDPPPADAPPPAAAG
jgi:hypothetical protein